MTQQARLRMISRRLQPHSERESEGNRQMSVTKSEIIQQLASRFPQLSVKDAEVSVGVILDAMADALIKRERVEIRGFGSFSCTSRPKRVGRNPRTGVKVEVPAKWMPHFKPGKDLRVRVDSAD